MEKCKIKIVIISTGGTIEKTYSELEGILHHEVSVLDIILERIRLEGISITRIPLMNKDSLNLTDEDFQLIISTVEKCLTEDSVNYQGVVIVHGTDRLSRTGELLYSHFSQVDADGIELKVPIVLTGAMRPYMMRNTDATQNLTEALLAVQLLSPGVYVAMHNRVLAFPGVVKDREQLTFVKER